MRANRVVCAVVAGLLGGGCSAGQGAPDGWLFLRDGSVAVAYPRTWTELPATERPRGVRAAAVLRGPDGQRIGELTVRRAGGAHRPAAAEQRRLTISGRPAHQTRYTDEDGARVVEVAAADSRGRPVLVRARVVGGAGWDLTLRRIVNSITVG